MDKQQLIVSYAREDLDYVLPLVNAVENELERRLLPIDLLMDRSHLQLGQDWGSVISEAARASIGFPSVSHRPISSKWHLRESYLAQNLPDRLIIPICLDKNSDLPAVFAERQTLILPPSHSSRNGRGRMEYSILYSNST